MFLKACSQCGEFGQKMGTSYHLNEKNNFEKRYYVKCPKCGNGTGDRRTRREAARAWDEGQIKFPK